MLEQARAAVLNDNVTFVNADAARYSTDLKFDLVMSVRVLEYIPEWRSILARLQDFVAPDGRAVIVTKTPVSVWRGTGRERWFGPHTMARRITGRKLDDSFWQQYLPIRDVRQAFADGGFTDIRVRPVIFGLPVYVRGTNSTPCCRPLLSLVHWRSRIPRGAGFPATAIECGWPRCHSPSPMPFPGGADRPASDTARRTMATSVDRDVFTSGWYADRFRPDDRNDPFHDIYGQKRDGVLEMFGDLPDGAAVLDLGGGMGRIALPLTRRYRVTLCDISTDMLEMARATANRAGLGGGRLMLRQVDANLTLPFETGSFAAALALDLVVHLRDPTATLRELHRVLTPDGSSWLTRPTVGLGGRSATPATSGEAQVVGTERFTAAASFPSGSRSSGTKRARSSTRCSLMRGFDRMRSVATDLQGAPSGS